MNKTLKFRNASILAASLIAAVFVAAYFVNQAVAVPMCRKYCEKGEQYLSDQKYSEAENAFEQARKYSSNDEYARLGLAETFVHTLQNKQALKELSGLRSTNNSDIRTKAKRLQKLANMNVKLNSVGTDDFPYVTLNVSYDSGTGSNDSASYSVTENSDSQEISKVSLGNDQLVLEYSSVGSTKEGEKRSVEAHAKIDDFDFVISDDYKTPPFKSAKVSLVSTDVSNYPTVRTYYRIETDSGKPVNGIPQGTFVLREKLSGGSYLERKVTSACQLEDGSAMAIDLVADKSGSIGDSDLERIKQVMKEFTTKLHYDAGDIVEVLGFNTSVSVLCPFSKEQSSLDSGIDNMESSGDTALYDALIAATNRVAQQSGSRCVIAFTDGLDNSSEKGPGDVIDYAKECNIPVFIIGVGGFVDEPTLRNIAESTKGKYWHIDDLSDLQDVYASIYDEQKKLYVVEYTSDSKQDAYSGRDIQLEFSGNGYDGKYNTNFTPKKVDSDNGGVKVNDPSKIYSVIDQSVIDGYVNQYCKPGTNYSVYVKDLVSGAEFGTANAKTAFSASAMINVPVLFTIAAKVKDGSLKVTDYTRFSYTYSGRGVIEQSKNGQSMQISYLIECMLKYSDNNATNSLINYLTLDEINNVCHKYDFLSVDLERELVPGAPRNPDNYVSACDLVGMLEILYSDTLGFGKDFMTKNFAIEDSSKMIGVGQSVSSGATFLNHNAILPDRYNEAAIVTEGGKSYIIAVLSDNGGYEESAAATAAIAKYVHDNLV